MREQVQDPGGGAGGNPPERGAREPQIALLVARFNSAFTEQLLSGSRRRLIERGVARDRLAVCYVPGAWDLPQAALALARSGRYAAIIALGCVIRGETSHFDFVAGHASDGLGQVALSVGMPVVFGVLTTENAQQASARADVRQENRGSEFADAALSLLELYEDHR